MTSLCLRLAVSAAEPTVGSLIESGYTATRWTIEDGLPMQNITALAQTGDGFLWCGTADGLVRFDGYEFKVYFIHEVPELEGFLISSLHADQSGRLWILDHQGRVAIREDTGFHRLNRDSGVPENGPGEIYESGSGEIWLQDLATSRFSRWVTNRFEVQSWPGGEAPKLKDAFVGATGPEWAVRAASDGLMQFTQDGLRVVTLPTNRVAPPIAGKFLALENGSPGLALASGIYTFNGSEWIPKVMFAPGLETTLPSSVCRDRRGNFWMTARDGGLFLIAAAGHLQAIALPGESPRLNVNVVRAGREGNVWAGTSEGLYRIGCAVIRQFGGAGPAAHDAVQSLAKDSAGGIWVAQDHGLARVDWSANQLEARPFPAGDHGSLRLAAARDGGIWLATSARSSRSAEIWRITDSAATRHSLLPVTRVEELRETRQGELLAATTDGLYCGSGEQQLTPIEDPPEMKGAHCVALIEDRGGDLYAGLIGVGLYRRQGGAWQRLTTRRDEGSDRIQSFCMDQENTLWIAADRPGLARWQRDHWTGVTASEAELPRKVRALIPGEADTLWLSSRWGLVRVKLAELNRRAEAGAGEINSTWLDRGDGLPSIDCAPTGSGLQRDSAGRIWIATAGGLGVIEPSEWLSHQQTRVPPLVRIDLVSADDLPLAAETNGAALRGLPRFAVPPGSRRVEIRFTGINLTAPEKMRFRHRLEGFQDDWVEQTAARTVQFHRLPVGEYRFQLLAMSNDGVWNREGTSLTLVVQPHWWQRSWIRAGAAIALLGCLWFAGQHRIQRLKHDRHVQTEFSRQLIHSQEQERKRIAGELHDSLGQNLLVAKNLALLGMRNSAANPDTGRQFSEISAAVGKALNEARDISKALRPPELDRLGLTKALRGMVQRAGEVAGLNCQVQMDDIDGLLPPGEEINLYRLVQEGMNNIVKHAHATTAEIRVAHEPEQIAIHITDDGRGFDVARARASEGEHLGIGLKGMEERVRLAGGSLEIVSQPGLGTRLAIRIAVPTPRP